MMEPLRDLPVPDTAETAKNWRIGEKISSRGVVATILRHEVRQLTATFRFRASAILVIFLMVLAAVTSAARYRGEVLEQAALADDHARELAGATVDRTVDLLHPAIKTPWRLSLVV